MFFYAQNTLVSLMHRHLHWFALPFPYQAETAKKIKELQGHGVIVYVQKTKGILWHLSLQDALKKHELPTATYESDISKQMMSSHGALEIFLQQPSTPFLKYRKSDFNQTQELIHLQRATQKPFIFIPHFLALKRRAAYLNPTSADSIFGSAIQPGFLRTLLRFFLSRHSTRWEICAPLDLKEFVDRYSHLSDTAIALKVRFVLFRRLERIEQTINGPHFKTYAHLERHTIKDPDFQLFLDRFSAQSTIPPIKLIKKAKRIYAEMASRHNLDVLYLLGIIFRFIVKKIYNGVYYSPVDIQKIRTASQKGPLIIVPAHRSHMDYMLMSYVFFESGLMPPLNAAGINLAFFPVGWILRRAGAYFIRRSFNKDTFYVAVLRSYIGILLKEGFTQEFFIEGRRSRSGKILPPQFGLLSILVDAILHGKSADAVFVPASISYEKLIESKAYHDELEGGDKTPESTSNLMRSTEILTKRYGRVFITFDEPISFQEFRKEQGSDKIMDSEQQRALVKSLGERIVFGMNRCSVVTPTALIATALFGVPGRILSQSSLIYVVRKIIQYLLSSEGNPMRLAEGLKENLKKNLDENLNLLISEGSLIGEEVNEKFYIRINEQTALRLDFYKNNLLHAFVADAILSTAFIGLRGSQRNPIRTCALFDEAQMLAQIFKVEFVSLSQEKFSETFERRLEWAQKKEILFIHKGLITLNTTSNSMQTICFGARLIANFVDAYFLIMQKIAFTMGQTSHRKNLVSKLLQLLKLSHLNGTLHHIESVNKAIVENAIRLLIEQKILIANEDKIKFHETADNLKLKQIQATLQRAYYGRIAGF